MPNCVYRQLERSEFCELSDFWRKFIFNMFFTNRIIGLVFRVFLLGGCWMLFGTLGGFGVNFGEVFGRFGGGVQDMLGEFC